MARAFDYIVYIGRFQPFHMGHLEQLKAALKVADRVIMLVGSTNRLRTIRNPWTYAERVDETIKHVVASEIGPDYERIVYAPLPDRTYDDTGWIAQVQMIVKLATADRVRPRIAISGDQKDATATYLDLFPQWEYAGVEATIDIHATRIRSSYFERHSGWIKNMSDLLPDKTIGFMAGFSESETFQELVEDRYEIERLIGKYGKGPFVAGDPIVMQSGHVLTITRGNRPNRGALAIPGGFLDMDKGETLYECALRELEEETSIFETGLTKRDMKAFYRGQGTFDDVHRSERSRIISQAFIFELPPGPLPKVEGRDDAGSAAWTPLSDIGPMFDDHQFVLDRMVGLIERR